MATPNPYPDSEPFGDGLTVHRATADDVEELFEFLINDFLVNEPISAAIDARREDMEPLFKELIGMAVAEPRISYIVRNDADSRIAAVRLTSVLTRQAEGEGDCCGPVYPSWKPTAISRLLAFMEAKTWEILPLGTNKLATWIILSVSRDFTRRGLGQRLIEYRLDEVKATGCTGIVTEATALNSQKLFAKLGYKTLMEVLHKDWLDENGKQIFKCLDATDRAKLCYIDLQK